MADRFSACLSHTYTQLEEAVNGNITLSAEEQAHLEAQLVAITESERARVLQEHAPELEELRGMLAAV